MRSAVEEKPYPSGVSRHSALKSSPELSGTSVDRMFNEVEEEGFDGVR